MWKTAAMIMVLAVSAATSAGAQPGWYPPKVYSSPWHSYPHREQPPAHYYNPPFAHAWPHAPQIPHQGIRRGQCWSVFVGYDRHSRPVYELRCR